MLIIENLELEVKLPIYMVEGFMIKTEPNMHASLAMFGVLMENPAESIFTGKKNMNVQVKHEGKTLFRGFVEELKIDSDANVHRFELNAYSYSKEADKDKHTELFQDVDETYMDISLSVMKKYLGDIRVCDVDFNKESIKKAIANEWEMGSSVIVFPELVLTAYTCNDLFFQDILILKAKEALKEIVDFTKGHKSIIFIGLPWDYSGKLYNVVAAISNGMLLGLINKINLPNYGEFYEKRYFNKGFENPVWAEFFDDVVPMGSKILFQCSNVPNLVIAGEVCEDLWVANPPSVSHALAGANVIINASASNDIVGKKEYKDTLISNHSKKLICSYIYANAGEGESTQDLVFGGQGIIAENGKILAESTRFKNEAIRMEIDLNRLSLERRKQTTFEINSDSDYFQKDYFKTEFELENEELELKRSFDPKPFVPDNMLKRKERCEEILTIQALGLKKRLLHTGAKNVILGISGGLDSTLALLVCVKTYEMLGLDKSGIKAITMPGFGPTDRTYNNACELTESFGATLEEISIVESIKRHFMDIKHDINVKNVTYENAQARERTQILMDIANRDNGLVVGTGDLSELVLGWATYNGDHMSMYGVNASIPKTLVRHLVNYYADTVEDKKIADILYDILDTPVSPELLPPENGEIAQKTEDLVGPYELHDFFLYNALRFGFLPSKIYRMAKIAFKDEYNADTILKWLKVFYKRFFSQQFKRSALPDGPKVGSISISPRGDLRMPSDGSQYLWQQDLENIRQGTK